MADTLLTVAAFAITAFGLALLSLTQERHWSSVARGSALPHPSRAALRCRRWIAGSALAAGCGLSVIGNGTSFGVLLYVVLLGACAMSVALTLAWKPQWLRIFIRTAGT